jgi:peptide/nickel transport system substrate-binding protein
LISIPSKGGTLTEGIVGTPRFINPVLAVTDADKDLDALVYAGLLHATSDGSYENLLAQSVNVSADGKTYFVQIKPDALFQDNTPVTADDIIYTINLIEDPLIKSPLKGNWDGVTVEKIDNYSVEFHLKSAYAPFLENLTIGILPKHIWGKVSIDEFPWSDLNLNAMGAGPYRVVGVSRDSSGIPSEIDLKAFPKYEYGEPNITNIKTIFYSNESKAVSALISNDIDSLGGISPDNASLLQKRGFNLITATLPRVFGLFWNQNQNKIFSDKNVRQALSLGAPREDIVSTSLGGFAQAVDGPLGDSLTDTNSYDARMGQAMKILDSAGYKIASSTGIRAKTTGKGKTLSTTVLKFSIATADAPDLVSAAHLLADSYKSLGFDVSVNVYESGDLQQNIIRGRKYDALLFGEVVGRDKDLFPFWHSSERFDPGLNIALYANSNVDKLLDTLRTTSNTKVQQDTLNSLLKEFDSDIPAAFLYAPKYVYAIPSKVKRVELKTVNQGSERFLNVSSWYTETDNVWQIFASQPVSN